jgi:hypothetical protein
MRRASSGVIVTPVPLPTVPLDGRVLHDGSMTTGPDDLTLHWEDLARSYSATTRSLRDLRDLCAAAEEGFTVL